MRFNGLPPFEEDYYPEHRELLQDARSLGGDMDLFRSGELGSEALLFFNLVGQHDRYFDLGNMAPEDIDELAAILLNISAAIKLVENGTQKEKGEFFMEHAICDHLIEN